MCLCDNDWSFISEAEDVNIVYDSFIEKYIGIICTCFPFNNVKKKRVD